MNLQGMGLLNGIGKYVFAGVVLFSVLLMSEAPAEALKSGYWTQQQVYFINPSTLVAEATFTNTGDEIINSISDLQVGVVLDGVLVAQNVFAFAMNTPPGGVYFSKFFFVASARPFVNWSITNSAYMMW